MRILFTFFVSWWVMFGNTAQAQKPNLKFKPYTFKEGNYSIAFPKPPTEKREHVFGGEDSETYALVQEAKISDTRVYLSAHTNFPAEFIQQMLAQSHSNPDSLLVSGKNGVFKSQNLIETDQHFTKLKDHSVLHVSGKNDKMYVYVQMLLVGNRIYQQTIQSKNALSDKETKAFFGTFKLLE